MDSFNSNFSTNFHSLKTTECSKIQNICKANVIAGTDIPAHCIAGPYPGEFHGLSDTSDDLQSSFHIKVKFQDNTIVMEEKLTNQWLFSVQPARDRHEQNAEFFRSDDGQIYLKTLRQIVRGEKVLIWYSEELARKCGIPFLSLVNIQGKDRYVCNACGKTFKFPNPLKSHIQFSCKLSNMSSEQPKIFRPYLDQDTKPQPVCSTNDQTLSTALPSHMSAFYIPNVGPVRQCQPHSHDKPMSILDFYSTSPAFPLMAMPLASFPLMKSRDRMYGDFLAPYLLSQDRFHQASVQAWHTKMKDRASNGNCSLQNEVTTIQLPLPSEVDGEPLDLLPKSFFANKSQKGHLCLYCGKLYSRKYGLKIHLRTHTGYKPLKCKVCLRPFGDPSNLNKHVRLHAEGDTPYRCDQCGKVLVRRRDLERHIKSRHPICQEEKANHTCEEDDNEIVVT